MDGLAVSIIVPCHNEAATIGRKLDNCLALACADPIEILVVDDHSSDGTLAAAEAHLRAIRSLLGGKAVRRLLTGCGSPGKNGVLQTALAEARGSLYLITDADVLLAPDTLEHARRRFEADPQLGALCLSPRISSPNALTTSHYAGGYEAFNRRLKMLQSRLDSLPILHGQAMFIRASLGIEPHQDLPADDVDFAFQVRLKGSRVRYAHDLPFFEEISPDSWRVFAQKIRRAKAVMRSFWRYRRMLLSPRYGLFGLVCFPLDFGFYFVLAPLTLLGVLAGALWLLLSQGLAGSALLLGAFVVAVSAAPVRRVILWLAILLVSLGELLVEERPRIRWMTDRSSNG